MRVRIGLKSHQQPMAEKLDELYSTGKKFAGIILATGGGKSFLAMDQIIKFAEDYNDRTPITEEQERENPRLLSAVSGYYVCPQNPISLQFRIHMISNIIGPEHIMRYEEKNGAIHEGQEIEAVKEIMQTMAPELDLRKIKFKKLLANINKKTIDDEEVTRSDVVQKMIAEIVSQYKNRDLKKVVDAAFPNFKFITYKSLENKKDEDFKNMKSDFIIIDEAHRSGAEKWWPKIKSFIKYSEAKVLSITATPERDVDEKDMMRDLASLDTSGYSVREIRKKEYLAGNMPLLKAIEGGHITPPDVVHFNCKLDETPEFEAAVRAYIKSSMKIAKIKSGTNTYYNAMNSHYTIQNALSGMITLTRKDPLIDYDDTLTPEEKELRKREDEENVKKQVENRGRNGMEASGIIPDMNAIIRDGTNKKLSEEEIFNLCMGRLRTPEWEALKKQRISTIISKEIKARGLEDSKGINFMESMEGKTKETTEQKEARAKVHVKNQIEKLKDLFDTKIMALPKFIALHSTAFSDKENDENLEEFMENGEKGIMKIITAVSKFNEGFHADGVRALFMTTPIQPNPQKESEPRIKLLQQIGRCLSAGKKEPSVIFDIACNFMRNHEKFKAESEKECFAFLGLSEEEKKFLELAKTISNEKKKTSEVRPDTDKLITILEVLNKKGIQVNSETIKENMNLDEFIFSIQDEDLREDVLDELFLKEIELETDSNFDMGRAYRYARDVYIGKVADATELKKLSKMQLPEMLRLGIIETQTPEGIQSLEGRINKAGFIVRGVVPSTFAYNVYTGTKFDGPDTDPDRKDYFGCGPDGRDPAGFDRYGFDADGIHRVTGKMYDERYFTPEKGKDGNVSWSYVNPKTGEKSETDPLGFNHEGINPKTGFDRDGYWHRREADGTFSIGRSKLNDEKMDSHGFFFKSITEKLGLYRGAKMRFKNERGLHSNGSIFEAGIGKELDRYGLDGRDIDGFDSKGFNADGIHRDTSAEYGLDGKDRHGVLHRDLKITTEIMSLLKTGKVKAADLPRKLGKTQAEIDAVISSAYSMSRTLSEIAKIVQKREKKVPASSSDVIGLFAMTKTNPKAVDELFKLSPSMRKQVERELLANRTMNKYCSDRITKLVANFSKSKSAQETQKMMRVGEELANVEAEVKDSKGAVPFRRPDEDDFVL